MPMPVLRRNSTIYFISVIIYIYICVYGAVERSDVAAVRGCTRTLLTAAPIYQLMEVAESSVRNSSEISVKGNAKVVYRKWAH